MNHDLTCLTNANKWYRELRHDHHHRIVILFFVTLHAWFILQIFKTVTLQYNKQRGKTFMSIVVSKTKPKSKPKTNWNGMNRISYKLTDSFFFDLNFFRRWWHRSYIIFFETRLRPQASCFFHRQKVKQHNTTLFKNGF